MTLASSALALYSSSHALAQKRDRGASGGEPATARAVLSDEVILSRIHRLNLIHIRAGSLAQQKGTTAEIRGYGAQLVRDHTIADERVKQFANAHDITLREPRLLPPAEGAEKESPTAAEPGLSAPQQGVQTRVSRVLTELPQLEGAEFDTQFLNLAERSHEFAVSILRSSQDQLPDSPLKNLIAQLLPTLTNHYVTASRLDLKMDAHKKSQGNSPQ
jgi:predicted outer membrane protein